MPSWTGGWGPRRTPGNENGVATEPVLWQACRMPIHLQNPTNDLLSDFSRAMWDATPRFERSRGRTIAQ
jgi:hypothetical protein